MTRNISGANRAQSAAKANSILRSLHAMFEPEAIHWLQAHGLVHSEKQPVLIDQSAEKSMDEWTLSSLDLQEADLC